MPAKKPSKEPLTPEQEADLEDVLTDAAAELQQRMKPSPPSPMSVLDREEFYRETKARIAKALNELGWRSVYFSLPFREDDRGVTTIILEASLGGAR